MSKRDPKKIIKKISRKNLGSSVLEDVPSIEVEPKAIEQGYSEYRKRLDNLYGEEVTSEYIDKIKHHWNIDLSEFDLLLSHTGKGFKGKAKKLIRYFLKPILRDVSNSIRSILNSQQKFNQDVTISIQKLIDLTKKSNDVIADKITVLESKYDALINEIVHKYLVNFTRDLVSRMDILYRRLDENFISHDVDLERVKDSVSEIFGAIAVLQRDIKDLHSVLGAQRRIFENAVEGKLNFKSNDQNISHDQPDLKDLDYVIFENRFRGESSIVKARQSRYLDRIRDRKQVLDIACGRGEFLELMKENGIEAEGIDLNKEMIRICIEKGLKVEEGNALSFLKDKKDSYDLIFCSNLIEHLYYPQIRDFIKDARTALNDGGMIILETINPESLNIFAGAMYLDLTHIRPLHPHGLEALLQSSGFKDIEIIRSTDVEEDAKLEEYDISSEFQMDIQRCLAAANRNIQRLNTLIFGYQEYAVLGYKV